MFETTLVWESFLKSARSWVKTENSNFETTFYSYTYCTNYRISNQKDLIPIPPFFEAIQKPLIQSSILHLESEGKKTYFFCNQSELGKIIKQIMAKIISNDLNFPACNHGFACKKLDKLSPGMVKMQVYSTLGSSLTVRSSAGGDFFGRRVALKNQERRVRTQVATASDIKMSISIGKSLKWWEKGIQPNMKEITGAEDLVESLKKGGDKLVVVDFFSPGCGGCRALHPKICQLAEMNPDVQFLQVNYEDHKSMCYSLNVHVLPFFRFYRGAEGRLCSFSCTNATIKKFKDALAKHKPDRCSLGSPKGLEEKELVALGNNRDLSFQYTPKPEEPQKEVAPPQLPPVPVSGSNLPLPEIKEDNKDKNLVSSGR